MNILRNTFLAAAIVMAGAAQAQVKVTTAGVGTVKIGETAEKSIPKSMTGLYNTLKYEREENEMNDVVEVKYEGKLNGEDTVEFLIGEGGKVTGIEFDDDANIQLTAGKSSVNPWTLTAKTLFAKGAKAYTYDNFQDGFYFKWSGYTLMFKDDSLTATGKKKVNKNEGTSVKLTSADVKSTAKPKKVFISK